MVRFRFGSILLAVLLVVGCRSERVVQAGSPGAKPGSPLAAGVVEVSFLDVGQGDAALVRLPGPKNVLIDGGPSGAGQKVLRELRDRGVSRLDWMIGTHPHEDHIGGLIDVLREMPVDQALDPGFNHGTSTQRTYLQLLKDRKVKVQRARAGQSFTLGEGCTLQILAPEEPLIRGTNSDPNNNSIVARVVKGETEFLFTGDMEVEERTRLLRSTPPDNLRSDVLKVAHHGSHNGTDPEFLRAVRPTYGVISVARVNDYGHPHREAVQALESQGVKILRTDQRGTITFTTDGKNLLLAGAAVPTVDRSSPAGRVVGNSGSKVYHTPDCASLPAASRRVTFASAAEAERSGYRPHRACIR